MNIITYNDSPDWVNPVLEVIGKKCSNKPYDIGDYIKEVVLCISLHNLITEGAAIDNQAELHQRH